MTTAKRKDEVLRWVRTRERRSGDHCAAVPDLLYFIIYVLLLFVGGEEGSFLCTAPHLSMVGLWPTIEVTGDRE